MTRELFNDDWAWRAKVSPFAELGGARGDWSPVTLPHDAIIAGPRRPDGGAAAGYYAGGAFEYRTSLTVDAAERGKFFALEFDGVYRDARVYVNGALAGNRAFGYSRFVVRIDPYLRFGGVNEVRVECRAHDDSRWYTGAGIYRDVHLVTKDPVHLVPGSIRVSTPDIDTHRAVVEVSAAVSNLGPVTETVRVETLVENASSGAVGCEDSAPVSVLPGETATVRQRLYVRQPELWSPEHPSLYAARLGLRRDGALVDEEQTTFGIRTLQVDPARGLRINGEETKLRGACIHHDNGPLGAASIARAEERRIEKLKSAGFNAIRSAHNPMSSALLDACDRLGMIVMDETFDVWTTSKSDFDYGADFPQWWERDVEAMVAKDFNHPSVIFYSIGNENPETGSPSGGMWSRRLAEKVRSLDPTRFVTNGINGFVSVLDVVVAGMQEHASAPQEGGVNAMMGQVADMMNQIAASPPVTERTEESFAVLDVAGMNYGDGRYESDPTLFPHRVIVGTETFPGRIAHNWALVTSNSHVLGDFTWTGWDYLGEAGLGAVQHSDAGGAASPSAAQPYPWLTASSGDLDITGVRRPVSYYRETVFGLRHVPYVAVHHPENYSRTTITSPWSWNDTIASWTWEGSEGKPVRVEVYSDADEVELLLDGTPVGRARVGTELAFRADFELIYAPGTLTAVAYRAGEETGRSSLSTAQGDPVLVVRADRDRLHADATDLAYLEITLADTHGAVHHGRDRAVEVAVDGPGALQALGTADPAPTESFTGTCRTTYEGRALAIVRPTGPGTIRVTVSATGCDPVEVELVASDAQDLDHGSIPQKPARLEHS